MGKSRASKRSEERFLCVAALFAIEGCGMYGPPATALALPDAPRQPDGVVVEPEMAVPEAIERASAEGVVALRPPLGDEAVVTVVHRLFRAFAHEDVDALQAILTEDAVALAGPGTNRTSRGTGSLLEQWRVRVKNPAYARLGVSAAVDLVDEERIARFVYEDLGRPGAPDRPAAMKPGELLVRFSVAAPTPRVGAERLFGDAMTLLLRRDGRVYRIAAVGEENGP